LSQTAGRSPPGRPRRHSRRGSARFRPWGQRSPGSRRGGPLGGFSAPSSAPPSGVWSRFSSRGACVSLMAGVMRWEGGGASTGCESGISCRSRWSRTAGISRTSHGAPQFFSGLGRSGISRATIGRMSALRSQPCSRRAQVVGA
jgi:hypothetical protein